jgi:hypothetical protein
MHPVLAEKAVEGASVVEDRKVFKPVFRTIGMGITGISSTCSTRTDPIRTTIGWEAIIIPTDISLFGGNPSKDSLFSCPQAAVPPNILPNLTPVDTDRTKGTRGLSWRPGHQMKRYSRTMMSFLNEGLNGLLS